MHVFLLTGHMHTHTYTHTHSTRSSYVGKTNMYSCSQAELKDICVSSGMADSDAHFERLFSRAKQMYQASDDDMLSVDSIRRALYAETLAE